MREKACYKARLTFSYYIGALVVFSVIFYGFSTRSHLERSLFSFFTFGIHAHDNFVTFGLDSFSS